MPATEVQIDLSMPKLPPEFFTLKTFSMRSLLSPFEDFLGLFYPHLCLACETHAPPHGQHLCTHCRATLPEARFHLQKENPFTERFWGRVNLQSGAALFLFTKESRVQHLLHQLKYKGKREIGVFLGQQFGASLKRSPYFAGVEVIVPVPLHPKKLRIRGYNQSECFAKGLSDSMGIPYLKDGLRRVVHAESQTRKHREERLSNVQDAFMVSSPETLKGRQVLLVDDVLTTGATLETCANKLLKLEGTSVSMATIAIAMH